MFKRFFNLKVRDELTKQEYGVSLAGQFDPDSAKAHVEGLPGSHGGHHPGLEVLGVEEVDVNGEPLPGKPAAPVADVVVSEVASSAPATAASASDHE